MPIRKHLALAALFASALPALADLQPIQRHCTVLAAERKDGYRLRLELRDPGCSSDNRCGSHENDSNDLDRLAGITLADLGNDGAHLTVTLHGEAGTLTCTGDVHANRFEGEGVFIPDPAFVNRMAQIGFTGYDSEKLLAYTFIGVESDWARTLVDAHVQGVTIDNLLALRIFHIDVPYVRGFTALGYPQPDADKLIGLKVQGVNEQEVREIRGMGYQPSLDELIQIRIFKITPDFIRRMQDRGFHNLTISKLVQIRIFNLAE